MSCCIDKMTQTMAAETVTVKYKLKHTNFAVGRAHEMTADWHCHE